MDYLQSHISRRVWKLLQALAILTFLSASLRPSITIASAASIKTSRQDAHLQHPLVSSSLFPHLANAPAQTYDIDAKVFLDLEQLARVVDIAYCVGGSGIERPFTCLSRCSDFPNFELVESWNTGPLLSDSCGYIALDHNPSNPRLLVAFRGTYSIANTIIDLSTIPQTYEPYPGAGEDDDDGSGAPTGPACDNCTVHAGFLRSWHHTRIVIEPLINKTLASHPEYQLTLVGHSLGGAVALLAALDFSGRGWDAQVTTFGEPKVGNAEFAAYVDAQLVGNTTNRYRRVTHVDDPVPLLPLTEWGYLPHAGELFITKDSLPPDVSDVRVCYGDQDHNCSATSDSTLYTPAPDAEEIHHLTLSEFWDRLRTGDEEEIKLHTLTRSWSFPTRLKLWQLFFAHRDYFWRLGVCLAGGDPWDWKGKYLHNGEDDG